MLLLLGDSGRRGKAFIRCSEGGCRCVEGFASGATFALPTNPQRHICGEKLYNHFSFASRLDKEPFEARLAYLYLCRQHIFRLFRTPQPWSLVFIPFHHSWSEFNNQHIPIKCQFYLHWHWSYLSIVNGHL